MNLNKIKQNVLRVIKPTKKEREFLDSFIKELLSMAKLKCEKYRADAIIVGSTGKQTWLRGDYDIDMFLMFPYSLSREALEEKGMKLAKLIAKRFTNEIKISYAEHPYVQAYINRNGYKFKVDIVPCYMIRKGQKIKSAVDRSPLHLSYILQNMNPTLRDEARLLKQFCKGIGVYGSDTKNCGVSGYVLEILTMFYGRFEDTLQNISKWSYGTRIDLEGKSKKRFKDPLIVIDPTDKNRNAAAALSAENFMKLIKKSKDFLSNPSENFFFPTKNKLTKYQLQLLKKRGTKFLAIIFDKPKVVDDIVYPQLRKTRKRIKKLLEQQEFRVIRDTVWCSESKCLIVIELEVWSLPKIKKIIGPELWYKKRSEEFLSKYKDYASFVENNRWVAEKEREFLTASKFLGYIIKSEKMENLGFGSYITQKLKKGKIVEHEDFWTFVKHNKMFSNFLREKYFEN